MTAQLPDGIVNSKKLGRLKLENVITNGIFLAPKANYFKNENNEEIIKIKGLKNRSSLTFDQFKSLLIKNGNISINQEKWFKLFNNSTIKIIEHSYNIKLTENKRELIYNENNILIGTKHIFIR